MRAFIIIVVLIVVILALCQQTDYFDNTIVEESKNGTKYAVQDEYADRKEAAELLDRLNRKSISFLNYLRYQYPRDERIKFMHQNFKPSRVTEGNPNSGSTSYSVSKGQKIVLCLRNKEGKFHDMNTLVFVTIHELGHLATKSYGHEPEFWDNFRFLLREATKISLYKPVNYFEHPVNYCGMVIYTNPLYQQ